MKILKTKKTHQFNSLIGMSFFTLCSANLWALPSTMNLDPNSASYTLAGQEGTVTFLQNNSVVSSSTQITLGASETLNVLPGGTGSAGWVGVIRDDSGAQSILNGTLDLGMRVFFLNTSGVLTGNNFTVDFSSLTNTAGGLVLSSHALNQQEFEQGNYELNAQQASAANITLNGLNVVGQGAEVLVLSDSLSIDGQVTVPGGDFHGVAAGSVDVMFGVGDMIAIKSALPVGQSSAGITATNNASVTAGNVDLQAWVADPTSLALNNQGVITATGITVNEQGTITLVGRGGNLLNLGTLDAADGAVSLEGNIVALGGSVETGDLQINVGGQASDGELRVLDGGVAQVATAQINGLGAVNTIKGLANYHVEGTNSGSAGWQGVNNSDWENNAAVTFDNVSRLFARVGIENDFVIENDGRLENDLGTGLLQGGARNDTFGIAGFAQNIEGIGGDDTFTMGGQAIEPVSGFSVVLVDGGGGIDSIANVYNPEFLESVPNQGTSDFVNWVNVQSFVEAEYPEPGPNPSINVANVIAPQVAFTNVSSMTSASLGLIGEGQLKLPCGYTSNSLSTADNVALDDEPCEEDYTDPRWQQLASSLVHFDSDSAQLTRASAERLSKVAHLFIESDLFQAVSIAGHTDDTGSEAYNLALSERRTASTARHLQSQGVLPQYIEAFHFGEMLPAKPNTSTANRAYNRRVHVDLKR
ncbi:OmpA family protein [Pseudomonadales bacterium]|nr:OmpA family protein [Pseudomonadales bacterium]